MRIAKAMNWRHIPTLTLSNYKILKGEILKPKISVDYYYNMRYFGEVCRDDGIAMVAFGKRERNGSPRAQYDRFDLELEYEQQKRQLKQQKKRLRETQIYGGVNVKRYLKTFEKYL